MTPYAPSRRRHQLAVSHGIRLQGAIGYVTPAAKLVDRRADGFWSTARRAPSNGERVARASGTANPRD